MPRSMDATPTTLKNSAQTDRAAAKCRKQAENKLAIYNRIRPLLPTIVPRMMVKLPFVEIENIGQIDPPAIAQKMNKVLGHVLEKSGKTVPVNGNC